MKTNSYIAIVLITIFLSKFAAIDANGLNIVFSGSKTSFVNPYCKKIVSIEKSKDTTSFSAQNDVDTQVILLSGNCTSPFYFDSFSWEADFCGTIVGINEHITNNINYCYLDNISPPPRLA